MNQFTQPQTIALALFIGAALGILIMGLLSSRDPFGDRRSPFETGLDRRQPVINPDTALLDYLERSEYNLMFNDTIDAGMWGVLNDANKFVAGGMTVRSAIHRAKEKDNLVALDALDEALAV